MDDWTKYLDQGRSVDVIYMDFMKAFDKVSHEHLLHKLRHLGVHQQILDWIHDFLNNRSQVVLYNNMSLSKEVVSGVPQGTVIGPSSFLSFVNDLPEKIQSSIYMFADDTKMYCGTNNSYNCSQLQSDTDRWSHGPPRGICFLILTSVKLWQLGTRNTHQIILWPFMMPQSLL